MTWTVQMLDSLLYPTYTRNWDDQMFRERILRRLDQRPRRLAVDI